MEECRESWEPVVNIIKGQQISASHGVSLQALLSDGGLQCWNYCRKVLDLRQQAVKSTALLKSTVNVNTSLSLF